MPSYSEIKGFRRVNKELPSVRRIFDAAIAAWSRFGYDGASLKDIAAEAGVAKSLLHYHFDSKEHLLIELTNYYFRKTGEEVLARVMPTAPTRDEAVEKSLDAVWEALLLMRHEVPLALELWRAGQKDESIRRRLEAFVVTIRSLLVQGIKLAVGPEMASSPWVDDTAALVNVVLEGFVYHLYMTGDVEGTRRIYEDFKRLVRTAILKPPAGSEGA